MKTLDLIGHPCPHCGREENGTWYSPCPSDDCPGLDDFTRQYIETALWSSNDESRDDGGDPLDDNYGPDDLAPCARARMIADCAAFQDAQADHIAAYSDSRAGHDFWLTRNGHGAGFWDGDWPEPEASALTGASKAFGECSLYIGDDKQIYHFCG